MNKLLKTLTLTFVLFLTACNPKVDTPRPLGEEKSGDCTCNPVDATDSGESTESGKEDKEGSHEVEASPAPLISEQPIIEIEIEVAETGR